MQAFQPFNKVPKVHQGLVIAQYDCFILQAPEGLKVGLWPWILYHLHFEHTPVPEAVTFDFFNIPERKFPTYFLQGIEYEFVILVMDMICCSSKKTSNYINIILYPSNYP